MSKVPIVEVLEELHKLRVPLVHPERRHTMSLWERIQLYASNYQQYQQQLDAPVVAASQPVAHEAPAIAPMPTVDELFDGIPVVAEKPPKLTKCQIRAWAKLERWLAGDKPFFILRGYAGTGKTFLMKKLLSLTGYSFNFTAPTNKATDVLAETIGQPCKTTFSYLGVRMVAEEDGMVLAYPDPDKLPYFRRGTILVVDEASIVGKDLLKFIQQTCERCGIRVLVVGDPMQFNPVGELRSPAWKLTDDRECRSLLTEVVRYDNQLLNLATALREHIKTKNWVNPTVDDNDGKEGVFVTTYSRWQSRLLDDAKPEKFVDTKVVAWRNKTVEKYNRMIRSAMGFDDPFCVGDRIMIAAPVERDGTIVATIDEEGVVQSVTQDTVAIPGFDVNVHVLTVKMKRNTLTLKIIHEAHEFRLQQVLSQRAAAARRQRHRATRRELWREFWAIKNEFHQVRYAYALTGHRIQGTTLKHVFVDQQDFLTNQAKREAFCGLYVSATRPTTSLYTF